MVYPQNSTAGLYPNVSNDSDSHYIIQSMRMENIRECIDIYSPRKHPVHLPRLENSLLHNGIAQRITHSVTLALELEGSSGLGGAGEL